MSKVINFIEGLEIQTLTDELKEDIMDIVNTAIDESYTLGYKAGLDRALEIMKESTENI